LTSALVEAAHAQAALSDELRPLFGVLLPVLREQWAPALVTHPHLVDGRRHLAATGVSLVSGLRHRNHILAPGQLSNHAAGTAYPEGSVGETWTEPLVAASVPSCGTIGGQWWRFVPSVRTKETIDGCLSPDLPSPCAGVNHHPTNGISAAGTATVWAVGEEGSYPWSTTLVLRTTDG
jgi:hypothetical protein